MKDLDTQQIPDRSRPNPAKRYLYLQKPEDGAFDDAFDAIGIDHPGPMPASGEMVDEEVVLETPEGDLYYCVSMRGDHEGWQRLTLDYAKSHGLGSGLVKGDEFVVTKGNDTTTYRLTSCRAYSTD